MKNVFCPSIIAVMLLLFAFNTVYTQPTASQVAPPGPDSLRKFCKELFLKNCSGCHGEKGQGTVGPNLTDQYWLHGGSAKNINSTIKDGVAGKGMIAWNAVFSSQEIQQITDCVVLLHGTNPAKAKAPEGELYEDQKQRPKEKQ
jgi:mono/diheme cytochrome c family protein